MSTETASPPTDDGRWEFLEDTYWYVPVPYLPAIVLVKPDPPATTAVVDQTLWHITSVGDGYVIGDVASNFGGGWSYATLVGSITPDGSVSFSFTPESGADLTVGNGTMVLKEGAWFFEMQMTTGSGSASITHWAYMTESLPGDRAWLSLPGYPDDSIPEVFSGDPVDAPPLTLYMGTDGADILPPPGAPQGVALFGLGGDDQLMGSAIVDNLDGGAGKDTMDGGDDADDLWGESGGDKLKGGDGADYLDGGKGGDRLIGGNDADLLHGGKGVDKFTVTKAQQSGPDAPDTILDFKPGKDLIDLHKIDDLNRFIGERAFTGRGGEVRYERDDGDTIVQGDTDGDGSADLVITLTGKYTLTGDDFLL